MTRTIAASDLSSPTDGPRGEAGWPVRLRGVTFGHAGYPDLLRGIDLTVTTGSFNFLTGRSGAGKSLLIGLMAGLIRADAGQVVLFGQDRDRLQGREARILRRRIGLIAQDDPLLAHLSVADNLAVTLRVTGEAPRGREADLAAMLDFVGLSDMAGRMAGTLSRGERRLVALARAMMTGPELILADEPLAGLDAASAKRMLGLLRTLNRQGATVFMTRDGDGTGHEIRKGDRRLHLEAGRLVEPERTR
ncbi:cell division ATP-binding protein FtsE [Brevundimonas sp.]|uniref:cell division ATP-binding protein FtsE n=1 Tax=Brevundimonas sp. TaxID=1871086 RepID=UPI003AF89867